MGRDRDINKTTDPDWSINSPISVSLRQTTQKTTADEHTNNVLFLNAKLSNCQQQKTIHWPIFSKALPLRSIDYVKRLKCTLEELSSENFEITAQLWLVIPAADKSYYFCWRTVTGRRTNTWANKRDSIEKVAINCHFFAGIKLT